MFILPYVEFYITNVCNYSCSNCNRFNNFNFKGHQKWDEFKEVYANWAKIIDFQNIGILGGEPFLNPDFLKWVIGIYNLWPNAVITVTTNGSQLHKSPEFFNLLKEAKGRIRLEINPHDHAQVHHIIDDITKNYDLELLHSNDNIKEIQRLSGFWYFVQGYNNVKDPTWPKLNSIDDYDKLPIEIIRECANIHNLELKNFSNIPKNTIVDKSGAQIMIDATDVFVSSTVIFNGNNQPLTLHDSNPTSAFLVCYHKQCHHFIKGKLYKCGPIAVLQEFIEQFPVDINSNDKELLTSYIPAECSWSKDKLAKFLDDLAYPIPQCKFCPEQFSHYKLDPRLKKIKIKLT